MHVLTHPPAATVGLDGRNLALARGTGVATYAATLARGIAAAGLTPAVLEAGATRGRARRWLAAARPDGHPAEDLFRTAQVHFDLWGTLRPVRRPHPPALMHWTYPLPLHWPGIPNLYTVHDLIPLVHPTLTGIDGARTARMLSRIAAAATRLVTVSDASARELSAALGIDPARITNTYQAVDVSGADPAPPPGLLPRAYWLHVGAVERRKNLPRLIAAWHASGTAHPLVLAGPDGWMAGETLDAAAPFATATPGVIRMPWLPRPALLGAIAHARALLMPSLAEGFGLPVAEAMALGTPVLTSHAGALAEVAGGAALLVDPFDGAAIATALRSLDKDEALRGRLAEAGPRAASRFSPEAYAGRLRALYAGLLP